MMHLTSCLKPRIRSAGLRPSTPSNRPQDGECDMVGVGRGRRVAAGAMALYQLVSSATRFVCG